eukprot:g4742.t2
MPSFQHRGSPSVEGSGGQEPPRKRQKGLYVPAQGQQQHQQHQPPQHYQQPKTPRYIPGGGGGDRSFSSPPPFPPFSPPTTPHANGRGPASGGQFGTPAASLETPQLQSPPLPHGANRRQVSFQGSRGVTLSFNYWVGRALSNQVLTPSVRQLVTSTLADEPAPEFVEKVPGANKVVVACVSGLGMATAEKSMAAGACPFLMSCSSVPVRHSFEPPRSRGPPRAADVQPGAALVLWGEKPTVSAEEIAAMSLTELFRDCEVTFAGSKSAGWKDDVSFHPSLSPSTPDPGVSSSSSTPTQQRQQERRKAVTCRGNFWRNQNRDRGKYTLVVEEDGDGGQPSQVRLDWDRWDEEILFLKEMEGKNIRFEAPDSSLSLTFSCARNLTDDEKTQARQPEVSSTPLLRVVVVDPSTPSSSSSPSTPTPQPSIESTSETDKPATTENSSAGTGEHDDPATAGVSDESAAPQKPPKAASGGGQDGTLPLPSESSSTHSSSNEVVVRIPLESLDPEAYSLTAAARYRLDIPIRVSEEGPGYVSTEEPMPPSPPPSPPHPLDGPSGGGQEPGGWGNPEQGLLKSSEAVKGGKEEEEEEEGEIEEGELEIPSALGAGRPGGKERVEYGGDSTDDEEEGGDEAGEIPTVGAVAGFGTVADGTGRGEGGVGAQQSGGQEGGGESESNGGLKGADVQQQQQRGSVFVPPSAEKLCPIPSGPRKGTVILGVDCEMVYTREGLELARATLVNVKGQTVYDELVKPRLEVTDHNTQFSGITAEMLKGVTRTLRDAQREILSFVGAETYLVGHSLDSDLKALRLVHRRLIDTSELYPSSRGMPFKNGLRVLSKTVLGRGIQGGDAGHDSGEDAFASLELALLKMHRGPAFEVPSVWAAKPNPPKESLFESLERRRLPRLLRCEVSGDLEARASAEHPPGTPLWSVFNCGYRREQDAVWAATRFRRKGGDAEDGSRGSSSSSNGKPSSSSSLGNRTGAAPVAVGAAHFPTAGGMLRDALDSLAPKGSLGPPDLMWVDLPCRRNDFDQHENDKNWGSLPEVDRAVSQLYDKMAEGTLLVVVCQGALTSMVNLMAKRTKSRWDANSKDRMDIVSGRKRDRAQISTFDRQDEDELETVTSECLNGSGLGVGGSGRRVHFNPAWDELASSASIPRLYHLLGD